jgi:hypothetical protein
MDSSRVERIKCDGDFQILEKRTSERSRVDARTVWGATIDSARSKGSTRSAITSRSTTLMCGYEFPWDMTRALEVALYRTYCVPSISALLDKTGEFYKRTQKRYDDTALIVSEMSKWGYDAERGREALRRINRAHSRFNISNDDYLYVLSTFIYEPVRWVDRFGWRKMAEHEKLASYYFWYEVGKRMGIREIPESYEKLQQFASDYERDNFRFAETNQRIGAAMRDLFASWMPRIFAPMVRWGIYALLDDAMLASFGFRARLVSCDSWSVAPLSCVAGSFGFSPYGKRRTSLPTDATVPTRAATRSRNSVRQTWITAISNHHSMIGKASYRWSRFERAAKSFAK